MLLAAAAADNDGDDVVVVIIIATSLKVEKVEVEIRVRPGLCNQLWISTNHKPKAYLAFYDWSMKSSLFD